MNIDDVARREGAALRERFDGLATPAAELTVEESRPRRRRRAPLVGIAVILAAMLAVLLLAPFTGSDPASGPSGTWRRFDVNKVFGPHASVDVMTAGGPGFVAVGSRTNVRTLISRAAVWTSSDGEHWEAGRAMRFGPGNDTGFSGLVEHDGVLIASTYGGGIWRSTDGATWRRVTHLSAEEIIQLYVLVGPRGFVAVGAGPDPRSSTAPVWTSSDGRRWIKAVGTGTPSNPIGLFPAAQLGDRWLALGPSLSEPDRPEAKSVFTSTDGVRWSAIPGSAVPDRVALPLVSNRRRTRVLAIQFEHSEIPGSFGGRLLSTRDGRTWQEIKSFHRQMPVANPDHFAQLGHSWVLGGNTGTPDGMRRASMWASPDLRHWYEMPRRLRGQKTSGVGVSLMAGAGRVLAKGGHFMWMWTPPD